MLVSTFLKAATMLLQWKLGEGQEALQPPVRHLADLVAHVVVDLPVDSGIVRFPQYLQASSYASTLQAVRRAFLARRREALRANEVAGK